MTRKRRKRELYERIDLGSSELTPERREQNRRVNRLVPTYFPELTASYDAAVSESDG